MNIKLTVVLFFALTLAGLYGKAQDTPTTKQAIERLQKDVPDLMQKAVEEHFIPEELAKK